MSDLKKQFSLDYSISSKHSEYDKQTAYERGFNDCKQKILKILQEDWYGADLSINSCDQHYINKIKEL